MTRVKHIRHINEINVIRVELTHQEDFCEQVNSVYNIIKLSTLFSQVLLLLISWKFPKEEYPTTRRKTFNLLIALSDIEEKLVVKKSLFCCPCPSAFVFFKFSAPVWGQGIYSCSIRPSPDSGKEPILADRAGGRLW